MAKVKRKELYFKKDDPNMSMDEWESLGKPTTWFEMYNKNGMVVYEDRAYGYIMLTTLQGKNVGKDFAVVEDVAVFGPSYDGMFRVNVPYIAMRD